MWHIWRRREIHTVYDTEMGLNVIEWEEIDCIRLAHLVSGSSECGNKPSYPIK